MSQSVESSDNIARPDISGILGGSRYDVVEELEWSEYLEIVALNPSTIVSAAPPTGSLLQLKYDWDHPREDKDDWLLGRAVHCVMLEPREFAKRYTVWTGGRRYGAKWDDFRLDAFESGLEVLTQEQFDVAMEMGGHAVTYPEVQELLHGSKREVTLFYVEDGVQCRGRVDIISTATHRLPDIKTARRIDSWGFGKDFSTYHYDIKLGLYQRWLNRLTKEHWPVDCIVLAKKPPYDVVVYEVPQPVLDQGATKGRQIIHRVKEAIETNQWPGLAEGRKQVLEFPTYAMDDDDETVEWNETQYASAA